MIDGYIFYFGFFGIGGIDLGGEGEVLVWKKKKRGKRIQTKIILQTSCLYAIRIGAVIAFERCRVVF